MSFHYLRQLPSPGEIKTQYPLSERLTAIKKERDAQIRDIITGKDDRFLVIIGPCSADSEDPVCEYVNRLAKVQENIEKPCQETEKGFGLANVNERIRMYYGPEYGMKIQSVQDEGTIVEITIPE